MTNFNLVTSRLATGGAISTPDDVDALLEVGITAIIDCRDDYNDQDLLHSCPNWSKEFYLDNPTADDGQTKSPDWFARSLNFALPLLSQPGQKIYAHCLAGVNRGPSTTYAILRAFGLKPFLARSLIELARPVCVGGIRYAADADVAIKVLGYE